MKKKFLLLVLFVSVNLFAEEVKFYKTSYDCTKTQEKSVAYRVCKNQDLAKEDLELSKVWKSFQVITKELKKEQLEWLKQKNSCQTKECIKEAYKRRIAILKQRLSNQNTYLKEALDGLKDIKESNMKVYDKFHIYSYKTPVAKEFLNAFMTFQMRFKKPFLKRVFYNDKRLKRYLGDCYGFRFDYMVGPADDRRPVKEYIFDISKYASKDTSTLYSLVNITVHNKPYYLLHQREHNRDISGLDYLINPKECKKLKEEIIPNDIKKGRFEDNWFYFEPTGKCKDLNLTKEECTLTKLTWFYIPYSGSVEAITYKGKDYVFEVFWIKGDTYSMSIYEISNKPNTFGIGGLTGAEMASIKYKKGAKNGKK